MIDPDSRLTQLGLLPLCPEDDYYFFESRSYGSDSRSSLVSLTQDWVAETFGINDARPYIEPLPMTTTLPEFAATVSFGVGENAAKRLSDSFEAELLKRLPRPLLIDKGVGGEEAERVERAIAACGGGRAIGSEAEAPEGAGSGGGRGDAERTQRAATDGGEETERPERAGPAGGGMFVWEGSFAGFAAHVQRSRLFAGYDSAASHVAAACGVPLLSVFAGFPCERMFDRWRPTGPGPIRVVKAAAGVDPWPEVDAALEELILLP